jgi:hypothetical protein
MDAEGDNRHDQSFVAGALWPFIAPLGKEDHPMAMGKLDEAAPFA